MRVNVETGKITLLSEKESESIKENLVEIDLDLATKKQLDEMRVSLKDNKSKLGKILVNERTKRNREKRRRKKL